MTSTARGSRSSARGTPPSSPLDRSRARRPRAPPRLGERLAGLQDLLGDVQDAAVAEGLIRETLSARGAGARYAFEAGRLVERLRSRADESMRAFLEEWPEIKRRRWRKWAM